MKQLNPIPCSEYPHPQLLQACTQLLDHQRVDRGVFLLPGPTVCVCNWDNGWSLAVWENPLPVPEDPPQPS